MAKPITATPIVTGSAALKIWQEMRDGTPNTPERVETFRRAEAALKALRNSPFQTPAGSPSR
jgi:hypothetical protein